MKFVAGRLESLVNYQTMIMSLTAMDIANASLLDEATAAAEAMVMSFMSSNQKKRIFLIDQGVLPQTIAVLQTRAKGFGIELVVDDVFSALKSDDLLSKLCGVLVQYPDVNGSIVDYSKLTETVHASGALVSVASDLLALTMLKPPGEWGADIVLGNSARFGVPAGYGGPHGAFFACTDKLKRKMPGRLIGRSKDAHGKPAYRLALQSKQCVGRTQVNFIEIYFIMQLGSSTFVVRRPRATFARVRPFSPICRPCMLCITVLTVCGVSQKRSTRSRRS